MRWFFGLVLVVALILGAAYGVGRFLLPNTLSVTREAAIERPRAAVFAMINDLKIVKEWSPYYALDPNADYTISDEPGPGQSMRWASTVRQVGNGRISIVDSVENQEVDTILDLTGRATLNSRFVIQPRSGGTSVAWSMSAECAAGWINVPCRYMNLIMRRVIQKDIDSGLARLKTLTEQLPNVNFEGLNPQFDSFEPQTFVYSTVNAPSNDQAEVDRAQALGLDQVRTFMSAYDLTASAPLVRVVTEYDAAQNRMSFRVGYPFSGPTPLTVVGVQIGQTPSGEALHVTARGSREQVRNTYAQIYAYLQAHRVAIREDGLPWEVVHAQGDDATPAEIEIFVPLQ